MMKTNASRFFAFPTLVILSFCIVKAGYGQKPFARLLDGAWWLERCKTPEGQVFNSGVIIGIPLGSRAASKELEGVFGVATVFVESDKSVSQEVIKNRKRLFEHAEERIANLQIPEFEVSEVQDRMDSFYSDPRNIRIKVIDAFYVVKMQIDGAATDLFAAQIQFLRMQPLKAEQDRIKRRGDLNFTSDELFKLGFYDDASGKRHELFCYGIY